MKVTFRKSFTRDLRKIKDKDLLAAIRSAIVNVESAADTREISSFRKLVGAKNCYRIRVGEYRIGVFVEGGIVEFVRCLPRGDLYRYFP